MQTKIELFFLKLASGEKGESCKYLRKVCIFGGYQNVRLANVFHGVVERFFMVYLKLNLFVSKRFCNVTFYFHQLFIHEMQR